MSPRWAEIAVTLPIDGAFTYRIPEYLSEQLQVGHRVLVPFGARQVTGFVLNLSEAPPGDLELKRIREIEARLDAAPLVPESLLKLCRFAADYYLSPLGEVLKVALPPGFTGASKLRYVLTAAGKAVLDARLHEDVLDLRSSLPDGNVLRAPHWAALKAAQNGLTRSKAPARIIAALETAGWLTPRTAISARASDGEVEMVFRILSPPLAAPFLHRAKNRRALYDAVGEGGRPVTELRELFGGARFRTALRRLVDDGVVETRAVASSPSSAPVTSVSHPNDPHRPELTSEQHTALKSIQEALQKSEAMSFLLQGVTGSGKTEVYLGAIESSLRAGRGAVVLVPEIALTPQLETRFRQRFGDEVVVLHSAVPEAERRRRWRTLHEGRARIALGPRSAIWAPVDPLGVIVVDEEHDASFKQQTELRYNGRDLAIARAQQAAAVVILGSATPSLEALDLVERERVKLLRLDKRVAGRPMPTIELVDLVEERRAMKGDVRLISRALEDELRELQPRGEQGIIFLNRRGFNTIVHCGACDDVKKCPHCDVSLTFHRERKRLACHYCGFEEPLESKCRSCQSRDVRPLGAGTERVVAALQAMLPELRILRLDRDITQKSGGMEKVLDAFRNGEADLLVGTQMVAKGHDFPRVTLVGIVLADASLAFPDFRAAERTFQLVTQVAGRAGRAERPGRVIVQTLQPDHYALLCALRHDVKSFYAAEAPERRRAQYPPYTRLGVIRAESLDSTPAERTAAMITERAIHFAEPPLRVLGPAPAPIAKVRDRHRFLTLLFAPTPARLSSWMRRIKRSLSDTPKNVDLIFDVDAIDLL